MSPGSYPLCPPRLSLGGVEVTGSARGASAQSLGMSVARWARERTRVRAGPPEAAGAESEAGNAGTGWRGHRQPEEVDVMGNATIEASAPHFTRAEPFGGVPAKAVRKRVLVLMPFGGEATTGPDEETGDERREAIRVEQRRAVLDFLRLKYRLGKLSETGPYAFDVDIAFTLAQDISAHGLAKVSSADVVIAVLHHRNINVMYEVAVRHLLRDEMILIVKGQPDEELPVYLRDKAYIISDSTGSVSEAIDFIARNKSRQLGALAFSDPLPPQLLQAAIDEFGEEEQKRLGAALEEIIST